MKNINDLNILFLAKFAPLPESAYPLDTIEEDGVYAQYHFDIYKIIKSVCPNVVSSHTPETIIKNPEKYDYVFSLLNRAPYRNSEIFVSALLEYYKIPYLGARPNIRAIAEDKHLAKLIAKSLGLRTAEWITLDSNQNIPYSCHFEGPYFIKPRYGASSKYIDTASIAKDWRDAIDRIKFLQQHNIDIIVEQFIDGTQYTVPIYFDNIKTNYLLPVKEISNLNGNIITYYQKRKIEDGLTRSIETDTSLIKTLHKYSNKLVSVIQPIDYTRIDYIIDKCNNIYFMEFNVCCNLGKQSAFCLSARQEGLSQKDLVITILKNSLHRQNVIG